MKTKGIALGSVLLAITTFLTLVFLATSASLSHLSTVRQVTQRDHAANLADAALATAIEKMGDSDFTFGELETDRVSIDIPDLNDAEGIVTFSPSEFSDAHSTYNLSSDDSVPGAAGRVVPARSVHLVAMGRVGKIKSWKEAIVHVPAFPDGLVASGPVEASGLLLMGVRDEDDYAGGDPRDLPADKQVPINLFSNSPNALTGPFSVILGDDSHVSGSVGSPGQIQVSSSAYIAGEVRPGSSARPLPLIDVQDRISLLSQEALDVSGSHGGNLELHNDWFNHASGGLNVTGDLLLNGSALTVRGPLQVGGAVRGTGVVLVDGDITIKDGGSTVNSLDQVALASTGDVSLTASNPEGNYFKGLVYTEGDFIARNITIVGSMVVNGQNGSTGSVTLENVRFVYSPSSVTTAVSPPIGTEENGHSTAVSLTLNKDSDGDYRVDARLYITNDGSVDDSTLNLPSSWDEPFDTHVWPNVNVGPASPSMGQALGREMGVWADEFETSAGVLGTGKDKADWTAHLEAEIPRLLNELMTQPNTSEVVSFNLNNVLAEPGDRARVLLWQPFHKK